MAPQPPTVGESLVALNTKMDQVIMWQTHHGYVIDDDDDHDRIGVLEGALKTCATDLDGKIKRVSDRQGVVAGIQTTVSLVLAGIAAWLGMRT